MLSDAQDQQIESNREIAIDFLTRAARGEAHDAMRRYAAPDFIHHNPWFAPDAESLATAMDTNARENPIAATPGAASATARPGFTATVAPGGGTDLVYEAWATATDRLAEREAAWERQAQREAEAELEAIKRAVE